MILAGVFRERFAKDGGQLCFCIGHGRAARAEESLERGDGKAQSAGVDQIKERQVGGDIEGKPVEGDPPAELDAHSAKL